MKEQTIHDMTWMAIRYCLGRHSIMCTSFAEDIKPFVAEMSDIDKSMVVRDIYDRMRLIINSRSFPFLREQSEFAVPQDELMNYQDMVGWFNLAAELDPTRHVQIKVKGTDQILKGTWSYHVDGNIVSTCIRPLGENLNKNIYYDLNQAEICG